MASYGHTVKISAPQFVKPYVKSNKNDVVDAEAIAEAAQRPGMRFVAIKSIEQQDIPAIHRIRSQAIKNRTALAHQIRGFLLERGIDIPVGMSHLRTQLPCIIENAENELSSRFRASLMDLRDELIALDKRVERYDTELENMAKDSQPLQCLLSIPGVGVLTAIALLSCIGDINVFQNSRELAAFLGLVPRQRSTGGRPTLLRYQQKRRCLPEDITDSWSPSRIAAHRKKAGLHQSVGV